MKLHCVRFGVLIFVLACSSAVIAAAEPLSMFETPRDGIGPVLQAITGATKSVDLVVYSLKDPDIIQALISAKESGKTVRVLLNQKAVHNIEENAATLATLSSASVPVKYANSTFTFTHEKAIVVDFGEAKQEALIMNMNLEPGYLGKGPPSKESLNFGIVDKDPGDIALIERIFSADWLMQSVTLSTDTNLVISPLNARAKLLSQIKGANKSVHILAQELADKQIIAALSDALKRGVEVKGLLAQNMKPNPVAIQQLNPQGAKLLYLAQPYEHAKVTIVDGASVYVGSVNYTATSMDKNRELGILVSQPDIVSAIEKEFEGFYAKGTPQD